MPQNYEDQLDLSMTPVDFLDSTGEKSERTKIRTYLGSLKYTADEMDHPIRELSGGQKAKVLLLKMSLGNANVLILDEPTRNFSPLSGPVIRKMLREFPGAIISISHDRKYIGEVCGKEYLLEKRRTQTDQRRKIKISDNEKYDGGWPSYFSERDYVCLKRRFRSRFCSGEVGKNVNFILN